MKGWYVFFLILILVIVFVINHNYEQHFKAFFDFGNHFKDIATYDQYLWNVLESLSFGPAT